MVTELNFLESYSPTLKLKYVTPCPLKHIPWKQYPNLGTHISGERSHRACHDLLFLIHTLKYYVLILNCHDYWNLYSSSLYIHINVFCILFCCYIYVELRSWAESQIEVRFFLRIPRSWADPKLWADLISEFPDRGPIRSFQIVGQFSNIAPIYL